MAKQDTIDKLPPRNIDAEKSLLGSLIMDKEAINKVVDFLHPEDFYNRNHQIIYEAILGLFERRDPIDLLSLSNKLQEAGHFDEVGGLSYLTSLANSVPTSAHSVSYAKIVQRKKMLRDLIDAANHIIGLGYQENEDVDSLLDEAEKKLFSVSQKSLTKTFAQVKDSLADARTRILEEEYGQLRGFSTGYTDLDELLGGFHHSDLIILAARPSVGKTAFAMNLALRFAKANEKPVGIFSLEMPTDQVIDRLIAIEGNVSLHHLRTNKISKKESDETHQNVLSALENLQNIPIYVDDSPSLNILQMRAMARRLQSEHGLGLLIVDYLQLMASRRNYDSPVQQVTEISRGLKALAKELNIPIIALSQLSRAIEQRDRHEPRLSDLRDSGSIEQDADLVMFIHREDKIDVERARENGRLNTAELIIAKHRNGPTGKKEFMINEHSLEFTLPDKTHTEEYLGGGANVEDLDMIWGNNPSNNLNEP